MVYMETNCVLQKQRLCLLLSIQEIVGEINCILGHQKKKIQYLLKGRIGTFSEHIAIKLEVNKKIFKGTFTWEKYLTLKNKFLMISSKKK